MKRHFIVLLAAVSFVACTMFLTVNAQAAPTAPDAAAAAAPAADAAAPAEAQVPEEVKAALEDFKATKFEDATKKLEEARKKNADMAPPQLILAQWFGLANQPRAVRQAIEQAVNTYPEDPESFVVLAELNLQNGGITEADLLYTKANAVLANFNSSELRKNNITKRTLLGQAQVNIARGKNDEALKLLGDVLAMDAPNVDALNLQGAIFFQQGKAAECLAAYAKVKEAQPNTLLPEARIAMMYQQKGDDESKKEAQKYMVEAIKKAPKDGDVRLVATQWSLQIGNVKQASQQADAALKLKENDANLSDAQLLRGVVALFEKKYDIAEDMFTKVLAATPSNFAASNNLALALCEQGDEAKLRKAEEYALVNVRQFQDQPEAFSTAAWITYKKGDYNAAAQMLQKSVELSRGQMNPDTAYYLAATLVKLGTEDGKKQAKDILTKVLENTTPFSMRAEAEELQKSLQ